MPRTKSRSKLPAREALASGNGYAGRLLLQGMKSELNERRLREIDAMLTDAGVPEWVENSGSSVVPSNTAVARLKWYLSRRKSVAKWEVDNKLQRDMAAWIRRISEHNGDYATSGSYNATEDCKLPKPAPCTYTARGYETTGQT